jgi:ribonuclease J
LRLLDAAAPFLGQAFPQVATRYRDRMPFEIGPFRVTPYLMDHSAYDAHALLIDAGGRRLFYTGDFRGHGRKRTVFERFLADPPGGIDLLLMEGTTLGRDSRVITESDVENEARDIMTATPGIVLVCLAGQNIDRLVGMLRASLRAGRTLIVDAYTACLVDGLGLSSFPDMATHPSVRVYLPRSQRRRIIAGKRFDLVDRYRRRRIFMPEIAADSHRFTMLVRASMIDELKPVPLAGGALLWSLWPGYLERDRVNLREWAEEMGLAFHIVHASGHAHLGDLIRMAERLAPSRLMPIHTRHPDSYRSLYPRVEIVPNGTWAIV